MTFPILAYLVTGAIQAPTELNVHAMRQIDKPSVRAHEPLNTRINIENQGSALNNLLIEELLKPGITLLGGQIFQKLFLDKGYGTQLTYRFKAARGEYSWSGIRVRASDPLGLFDLGRDISSPGELLVLPAAMDIRSTALIPRHTLPASGPIPARLAGTGTDFWGVREYRAGDSFQRLNWRLAARYPGKLFSNEFERQQIADYGLILDARRLTNSFETEASLFEFSIQAVAALTEILLKEGNRVSMLVLGKPIISVFPGLGKKQLNSIMRKLSRANQGTFLPFSKLEYFPTRLFPSRSQIIIFSSLSDGDLPTYARLVALGYEVLLISPDPVAYEAKKLSKNDLNALAVRAARAERIVMLKRLLKLGVNVVDWQVDQPLATNLHNTALRLNHRRNA
ncbi:MAG: DUF58 domain-containing protein [Anaerolineales bacterium]|nr:DUF58 domain-containing protein [Anaerolineales bacterium]